jgi:acyl-CoA thioesterase-1
VISLAGAAFVGCSGAAGVNAPGTQPSPESVAVERSIDTPAAASGVSAQALASTTNAWRYVALGDSYTIGTSVKPRDRWPNQLVRALRPDADVSLVQNLASNGATTAEVMTQQLPALDELNANVVSLLVGVNDVVRGVDVATYRTNLRSILALLAGQLPARSVVVVTTPDYTLTPAGSDYGERSRQSARIKAFNAALQEEASHEGMRVVDITPVSNLVPSDPTLLAADGLHPSGKQYAGWVELIAPQVREMVTSNK